MRIGEIKATIDAHQTKCVIRNKNLSGYKKWRPQHAAILASTFELKRMHADLGREDESE
ncbi:MAG: hypothetical protein ACYC4K_04590 [Thiobacillus sp.]